MAKSKVSKQIQQLFLTLLNFSPELLDKTQEEAKLHSTSFDALIRAAVEKHLRDLTVAPRPKEAESKEFARLLLQAHFAELGFLGSLGDDVVHCVRSTRTGLLARHYFRLPVTRGKA